jgi:hypothetical protein
VIIDDRVARPFARECEGRGSSVFVGIEACSLHPYAVDRAGHVVRSGSSRGAGRSSRATVAQDAERG